MSLSLAPDLSPGTRAVSAGGAPAAFYPAEHFDTWGTGYVYRPRGTTSTQIGNQGQIVQGLGIDNVNRWAFTIQEDSGGTTASISRYYLDGPPQQYAESACDQSADIGHSSISVDPLTGKLWSRDRLATETSIRYTYNAGSAISDIERFTFFADKTAGGIQLCCVDATGEYFYACYQDVAGTTLYVRVFLNSFISAASAGDYSAPNGNILNDWSVSGFFNDSSTPLQGAPAALGDLITIIGGASAAATPMFAATYDRTGAEMAKDTAIAKTAPTDNFDAGGGTVNCEPEGQAYFLPAGSSTWAYLVMMRTGSGTQNWLRAWDIGGRIPADNAEARTVIWEAAATAAGATPSAAYRAIVKTLYADLISAGLLKKMGVLYTGVVDTGCEVHTLINLADPARALFKLTKRGSPTLTPKVSYTSGGNAANSLDGSYGYAEIPNYGKAIAQVFVYTGTSSVQANGQMGTQAGNYLTFFTRNTGDLYQLRLNNSAADTSLASTDGSGLHALVGNDLDTYDVVKDGVLLGTIAHTAANAGTTMLMRIMGSATSGSGRAHYFHGCGYPMTLAELAAFKTCLDTYRTAMAAL